MRFQPWSCWNYFSSASVNYAQASTPFKRQRNWIMACKTGKGEKRGNIIGPGILKVIYYPLYQSFLSIWPIFLSIWLLKAELFTIDQKTVERIATVVKEAEKQGAFLSKKNKSKVKAVSSPQKIIEILEERDFDEADATFDESDNDEPKYLASVSLQRDKNLDRQLRENMTNTVLSSKYQSMNRKRKELPTYAKKQVCCASPFYFHSSCLYLVLNYMAGLYELA